MSAIWVEVTATRGSTPRDAGAAMKVTADDTQGTIGGGALEHRAIAEARALLKANQEAERTYPLGPDLGQCCGGAMTLRYSRDACLLDAEPGRTEWPKPGARRALWLWGAGHVGRAVVRALPREGFVVTWVDSAADRFPCDVPGCVTATPAADMPLLAARAPESAHHLIFTYSHDIDLALCAAILRRGPASIGLIGSATKKARFFKRLLASGLDPSPIACPIGDKTLGKAPAAIAKGVVQQLLHPSEGMLA